MRHISSETQGCLYGCTSHGDCSWSLHKSWKGWTLQWPPCRKDYLLCGLSDQTSGVISSCVSCREPGLPSSVYTDPTCTLQTQPKSESTGFSQSRLTLQGILKVEDWFAQKHLGIYSVISCSPQKWQLIYCVRKPWHAGGRRRTQ